MIPAHGAQMTNVGECSKKKAFEGRKDIGRSQILFFKEMVLVLDYGDFSSFFMTAAHGAQM